MEFAQRVWGERYQVVVTTHLNTHHLHCHFVLNSISFVDGKRCRETSWFKFRHIADEICKEHGLYYNPNPRRKVITEYHQTQLEKAGMPTRYSLLREAIDTAIEHSGSLKEFEKNLQKLGYQYQLSESRKYWTVTPVGIKKPIRLINLGENYSNAAIRQRLLENSSRLDLKPFHPQTIVIRQYHLSTREDRIKKRGGLYGMYLYYCYRLGYLPKYKIKQNTARLHYLLREEENDDCVFVEIPKSKVGVTRKAERRKQYVADTKKESGISEISLYAIQDGENGERCTGEELIGDSSISVENDAIHRIQLEKLYQAVESLSDDERELITCLYNDEPMTVRELSKEWNIHYSTISRRHKAILRKLKRFLKNS